MDPFLGYIIIAAIGVGGLIINTIIRTKLRTVQLNLNHEQRLAIIEKLDGEYLDRELDRINAFTDEIMES